MCDITDIKIKSLNLWLSKLIKLDYLDIDLALYLYFK